jgi:hypothetical protein
MEMKIKDPTIENIAGEEYFERRWLGKGFADPSQ